MKQALITINLAGSREFLLNGVFFSGRTAIITEIDPPEPARLAT
jgi:hypothetical protein